VKRMPAGVFKARCLTVMNEVQATWPGFHSTGMGDSISPTIFTFPFMKPNKLFGWVSTGTTLTTGFPRLVTTTGSRGVKIQTDPLPN
jgi:hypothetical protein